MAERTSTIPRGFCQCGCGGRTGVAKRNDKRRGIKKGEHSRFLPKHQFTRGRETPSIQYVEEDRGYSSPCWVWQGHISDNGYSKLYVRGRGITGAHVVYFEKEFGAVPEGRELDHLCRVRCCVNPRHLEAVTCAVNNRRRPGTKLTMEAAALIRELSSAGRSQASLARQFGCTPSSIRDVLKNRIYVAA